MLTNEKLRFFQELVSCNYNVYLWSYGPDLQLLETNCPSELVTSDAISFLNFSEALVNYANSGGRYPFILDTPLSLLWISAFEYEKDVLQKIHMIGPAFTGKNSHLLMKKELDTKDLSIKLRSKIFRQLDDIPIIPTTLLYQYAVMLHYCITGERITSLDIQFQESPSRKNTNDIELISQEHRGVWMSEQELLRMIREGSSDYIAAIEKSSLLSSGMKFDAGNPMRQHKSNALVLLTLCSRAAMEGGLNPSISYTLNDYYAQLIEDSKIVSELSLLCRTILKDFVERVRQTQNQASVSKQIQNICDYINSHLTEELSIQSLAEKASYTEYYFSQKFRKELGLSVNEYILRQRLEHAKLLLSATRLSIQDISEQLSFGSRSYFSTSFRKFTGLSPLDYRTKHLKL